MNATMTVKNNKLHIEVDLSKDLGISKSGKNKNVASTGGFTPIPGTDKKVNLNVICPIEAVTK